MITHLIAAFLAAGVCAGDWERMAEEARRDLSESAGQREEAVARSCAKIVAEETARYRALEAAALSEASLKSDGLLELLTAFRKSLTDKELRLIKEANAERKRLSEAGHQPDPDATDLFDHWEGRIETVLRPRYRAFAAPRKNFHCPEGSRPHRDYWGTAPVDYAEGPSVPSAERNALLPPAGACWAKDGERPVESFTALAWFFGRPGDGTKVTVYAAACTGAYERWWGENSRQWLEFMRRPVCVTMDLLDGSLPPGSAPEKYLRGPAVRAVAAQRGEGWRLALFPEEADYVGGRLRELGVRECRAER